MGLKGAGYITLLSVTENLYSVTHKLIFHFTCINSSGENL
jgi:hypothetical protein